MKDSTKKAVDKAIDNYRDDMADAATAVAIEAHISGDIAAHATMGIPVGRMEVQKEALLFGRKYEKLLKETGGTIIRGKRIDWLASHTEDTRKAVYETIRTGLIEGKPVADIGGKLGVPGTVAHDLEKLVIRDAKYKYVRIARTETAAIQNQGTLNRFKKNKITHVEVIDGTDFDEACAEANGQIWTVEYAASHELEHPNCTRSFSPVIPDDWVVPEEVEPVKRPKIAKKPAAPIPPLSKIKQTPTKTDEVYKLIGDKEFESEALEQTAFWNALKEKNWAGDTLFTKGKIGYDDVIHITKDDKIFAMSRADRIRDGILHIADLEVNPNMRRQGYGLKVMQNITNDGIKKGATRLELTSLNAESDKFYLALGMSKKGHEFSGNLKWMKAFVKEMK